MHGPPLRVLVVDDDDGFRAMLTELVEQAGHRVVGTAHDGAEGVRLARELRPDLVTMDIEMPVLDGLAAIEQIGCGPVIVLVSGSASPAQLAVARAHGVRWHVRKRDAQARMRDVLAAVAAERHAA